ncbi:Carbohydrate-binding module 48-containing protein [Spironucleus salmonicida]|uniref:Carbohydrate-binding module 48-containing protein n=1 Tax=Spironucleus salmonicida TaxID=348837 RepID=V6M1E4_9EUKA|nr:Carbohydrate-binding module 48-containing protein [Spironucleus salmonicida]|eukprot:EST47004.1 Carbohydrate-binding module 48-containing protein [Spironucleus salmonicida]
MYDVHFVWRNQASSVFVAGEFNNWIPIPLLLVDYVWQLSISLNQGEYRYKYIVNGNWCIDYDQEVDNILGHQNNLIQIHPESPRRVFRK